MAEPSLVEAAHPLCNVAWQNAPNVEMSFPYRGSMVKLLENTPKSLNKQ